MSMLQLINWLFSYSLEERNQDANIPKVMAETIAYVKENGK